MGRAARFSICFSGEHKTHEIRLAHTRSGDHGTTSRELMPHPTRLNILFFLPDQHRADWLWTNPGLPLHTPNLQALAAMGVTFTRAYTPSPLCAPARACLASGMDYARCRTPDNRHNYPLDLPTYYQALRDAEYRVAGVGKFDLHKDVSDPARMDWRLDGSRLLEEWGFTKGIDEEVNLAPAHADLVQRMSQLLTGQ